MSPPVPDVLPEAREAAFAVAYRMLGSVAEAEDVVQDTLLRIHRAQESGEVIRSPRAYAATVATRVALTALGSARHRRESYVGEWLPEPLVTDPREDPAADAETADSLSLAFLTLLEALSPQQRAAFLLHDVFGYAYAEIAGIVGTSEATARQHAARARRHLAEGRPRFSASREERDRLAERFLAAAREGDLPALEALLAEDVSLHGDGGGQVPALAAPVGGRRRVARTVSAWARAGAASTSMRRVDVNGQPGWMVLDADDRVIGVLALDVAGGEVRAVRSVVNPDKLRHLGRVGDMRALLGKPDRRS